MSSLKPLDLMFCALESAKRTCTTHRSGKR